MALIPNRAAEKNLFLLFTSKSIIKQYNKKTISRFLAFHNQLMQYKLNWKASNSNWFVNRNRLLSIWSVAHESLNNRISIPMKTWTSHAADRHLFMFSIMYYCNGRQMWTTSHIPGQFEKSNSIKSIQMSATRSLTTYLYAISKSMRIVWEKRAVIKQGKQASYYNHNDHSRNV